MRWPSVAGGLGHVCFVRHSNAGRQPRLQRRGLSGHRLRSNAYTLQQCPFTSWRRRLRYYRRARETRTGVDGRGPWAVAWEIKLQRGAERIRTGTACLVPAAATCGWASCYEAAQKVLFWRFWRHGIVMVIHAWLSWVDGWHVRLRMGIRLKGIRAIHAVDQN